MWLRTGLALACLGVAVPAAAEVRLGMTAGRVTLSATNATVAQILSEWARVGDTRIVNAERLGGAPVTLELAELPELQALEILLRGAGGYVIAPRASHDPSKSTFDRILIVAASSGRVAVAPPPPPAPPTPPSRRNVPIDRDEEANDPASTPNSRFAPVITPEPDPVTPRPAAPSPGGPTLQTPTGVARPGMMMPVPPPQDERR